MIYAAEPAELQSHGWPPGVIVLPPVHAAPRRQVAYSDPAPLAACDRCGGGEFREVTIHSGRSIRRDCKRCGRFCGFVMWYGEPANHANERERKSNG